MFKQLSKMLFIILVISKPVFSNEDAEYDSKIIADKKIAEGVATVKDHCMDAVIKPEINYDPISKLQKRIDEKHRLLHLENQGSEWQDWFPGTSISYAGTTCKLAIEGVSTYCKGAQTPDKLKFRADKVKSKIKTVKCEFNYEPALKIVDEAIIMKNSVSSDRKKDLYNEKEADNPIVYHAYPFVSLKGDVLTVKFGIHASNVSLKVAEFLSSQ